MCFKGFGGVGQEIHDFPTVLTSFGSLVSGLEALIPDFLRHNLCLKDFLKFCRFALGRKGTIQTPAANVNSDGATCAPRDRLAPSRRIGGPECAYPAPDRNRLAPRGRAAGPGPAHRVHPCAAASRPPRRRGRRGGRGGPDKRLGCLRAVYTVLARAEPRNTLALFYSKRF